MKLQFAPITPVQVTYDEAMLYCFCLKHNGYQDWRLPTLDEYNSYHQLQDSWSWVSNDPSIGQKLKWPACPVRDVEAISD